MEKIISPITGKSKYLLIENCEFVSNVKISNELKESLKLSTGKAGTLIVKNLPGTILNRENQNGRIYSTAVLAQAIREAKPLFETKQLLSQACEHPEGSFVSPTTASHVVTNAYIKKNVNVIVDGERGTYDMLFMDIEVLNTEEGKNLRALLEAECSVGTSIRGVGDMEGKYVKNYEFLGIDFVGNPSSSTFTRMPVSESVKVEMKDPRDMKETFTVTTSSTNVVRDLDQAAVLQQQLDGLGYGTVTKTSTKLDQETDPKTGAQTSIATLEAETSDDVADLDQALQMARNAMLNGTINVDSITIENIPEEGETKEAVEAEYVPEKTTLKERPVTEAKKEDDEADPNLGKKFVLHTDRGFVTFDKNAIDFTDKPEDALHFTEGKEENGMVSMSKVTEILDAMGIFEVEKYFQKNDINLGAAEDKEKEEGLAGTVLGGAAGAMVGHPFIGAATGSIAQDALTDSKLEEENGSNTKYVAQVTINDANGSNNETISVSAVDLDSAKNEISNLWEMKNKTLNGQGTVDILLTDTTTGEQLHYNPESQLLESNNDPIEVDDDKVKTTLDKNTTIEKDFDSPLQAQVAAFAVEQGQADPKLLVPEAATDNEEKQMCARCEKYFPVKDMEAFNNSDEMLCKSCYDVLRDSDVFKEEYNEADFEDPVICSWCKDMYEKSDCKKEKDFGWLCDWCQRALESQGVKLKFDDEINEDFTAIPNDNGGTDYTCDTATYDMKTGDFTCEDVQNEKLYSNPSAPSDDYEKEPLTDAAEDFLVTLSGIDWDIEAIINSLDDGEDIDEVIEALPDPWTIRLNGMDLDKCDGIWEIRKLILATANEQAPWAIKSAYVDKIENANTGEIYYNNKEEIPEVERDWSDDEHLDDTLAMYHNAGIDG